MSLFTAGFQFATARVFAWLLAKYGQVFDGDDPFSMPAMFPMPPDMKDVHFPQVILRSFDTKRQVQASGSRLDLIYEKDHINDAELAEFLAWSGSLGKEYMAKFKGSAVRIGCVLNRVAPDENPPGTLSRHFCKEQWIQGPLNRPGDFQLHAHKVFEPSGVFKINSWMRCSCAGLVEPGEEVQPGGYTVILVQHDFNSLAEGASDRKVTDDQVDAFLKMVPSEMLRVLQVYFP
ncbi:MAG: hypothetical protein SH850_20595 [Planctomycetaceae bacterium]|nr:hypothetical protein [Planctomycetaceae bacterium]